MAEIVLEGVSKRYPDGTLGLRETSFTIRDGELFILVGPSGCGKSTLLNTIVGLETISEGEIRVDGRRIDDVDPKDRNMAMVFQSYALYPHMTVRENIAFPLKLAKLPSDEIRRRVAEAGEVLQLTTLLDRKPHTLSGGQRQRVAMGRAIVRHPAVFLMDEPLSNLDAALRVQMRAEIARLQRRLEITMVYVTHDQTEAMTLGDRVAVLREGEVQQIGIASRLVREPCQPVRRWLPRFSRYEFHAGGDPGPSTGSAFRRGRIARVATDAAYPAARGSNRRHSPRGPVPGIGHGSPVDGWNRIPGQGRDPGMAGCRSIPSCTDHAPERGP